MANKQYLDWDNIPTVEIPAITMSELVYGEGHAPSGPSRPTRDIRHPNRVRMISAEDDISDGIPRAIGIEHDDTELVLIPDDLEEAA